MELSVCGGFRVYGLSWNCWRVMYRWTVYHRELRATRDSGFVNSRSIARVWDIVKSSLATGRRNFDDARCFFFFFFFFFLGHTLHIAEYIVYSGMPIILFHWLNGICTGKWVRKRSSRPSTIPRIFVFLC